MHLVDKKFLDNFELLSSNYYYVINISDAISRPHKTSFLAARSPHPT